MRCLDFLERIKEDPNFILEALESKLSDEDIVEMYKGFGGTVPLLTLLSQGQLVIKWRYDDGEIQNILDFFESLKVSFGTENVSFSFSTKKGKRFSVLTRPDWQLTVEVKKIYQSTQMYRAQEHCRSLLDMMLDQLGYNLHLVLVQTRRQSKPSFWNYKHITRNPHDQITHNPHDQAYERVQQMIRSWLVRKFPTSGQLIFELYQEIAQRRFGYKDFFYKNSRSALEKWCEPQLKIMEAATFYMESRKKHGKNIEHYRDLHTRLKNALEAYQTKTSTQSASSQEKTGATLEMSTLSRYGAINILIDGCLSDGEKAIFKKLPILDELRQELLRVSDSKHASLSDGLSVLNLREVAGASAPSLNPSPPPYSPSPSFT